MGTSVPFKIRPGLPFAKTIVATLPTVRDWWLTDDDFEVLAQIREKPDRTSNLILDLTEFLTVTMPSADVINIELSMKGQDTRPLLRSGHYDIFASDDGTQDARGYILLAGPAKRMATVTKETAGLE